MQAMAQALGRMHDAEAGLERAVLNDSLDEAALTLAVEEAKAAGLNGRTTPLMELAQGRIARVCVSVCAYIACVVL